MLLFLFDFGISLSLPLCTQLIVYHENYTMSLLFLFLSSLSWITCFFIVALPTFPFLHPYNFHKFTFRSTLCFLGYRILDLGFICCDRGLKNFYIVCHCKFIEDKYYFSNQVFFSPIATGPCDFPNLIKFPIPIGDISDDISNNFRL